MKKGTYRIRQPEEESILQNSDALEVVCVPGIAYDTQGNRIGYGKGYYDKFLKWRPATKIGIAFDVQIVDQLPDEKHDITMDVIITEKRMIEVRKYDDHH